MKFEGHDWQQLPFVEKAPSTAYNYDAYLLGIHLAQSTPAFGFLYNHYIELCSPANYNPDHRLAFFPNYRIDTASESHLGTVQMHFPASKAEFCDLLAACILSGSYVHIMLDEYFVPDRTSYDKRHFLHGNLVIGCNLTIQGCLIMGYRSDELYGKSHCPMDKLCTAFFSTHHLCATSQYYRRFIAYKPLANLESINHKSISRQLRAYLDGKHGGEQLRTDGSQPVALQKTDSSQPRRHGISIYDDVIKYLDSTVSAEKKYIDLRPLRLLWEHKRIMAKRITALGGIPNIGRSFNEQAIAAGKLEIKANTARLLSIMYRKHRTIAALNDIRSLLEEIRNDEKNLLQGVLGALS